MDVHRLARKIIKGITIQQSGADTSLRLELSTPRIPRLQIRLRLHDGHLDARFDLPDPSCRELVKSSIHQLESELERRGVDVGTFEVGRGDEAGPEAGFGQPPGDHSSPTPRAPAAPARPRAGARRRPSRGGRRSPTSYIA